jgi:hypothetical protein
VDAGRARLGEIGERRQGDRLLAPALERIHSIPRRRQRFSIEQGCGARLAWPRARQEIIGVRRIGARRDRLHPDSDRKDERLDPQAWLTDALSRIAAHPGAGVHRLRRRESRRAHQNPQGIDTDQRALKSTTSDAPLRPTPDAHSAS